MNRVEAVQATTDGLAILAGAWMGFDGLTEFPCDECGGMVDLTAIIKVTIQEADGSKSQVEMSEGKARELLLRVDLPAPPVMCDKHERVEMTTEKASCQ